MPGERLESSTNVSGEVLLGVCQVVDGTGKVQVPIMSQFNRCQNNSDTKLNFIIYRLRMNVIYSKLQCFWKKVQKLDFEKIVHQPGQNYIYLTVTLVILK